MLPWIKLNEWNGLPSICCGYKIHIFSFLGYFWQIIYLLEQIIKNYKSLTFQFLDAIASEKGLLLVATVSIRLLVLIFFQFVVTKNKT